MSITVIIPARDAELFLEAALLSVLAQTRPPEQILVVDDGSKDATRSIAEQFQARGDLGATRMRILKTQAPDTGLAAARTLGLAEATGDAIAFLDADDLWRPRKLERQWEALNRPSRSDLVWTHIEHFLDDAADADVALPERLAKEQPGYLPSVLMTRKSVYEQVGGFDRSLVYGDFVDWVARARGLGLGEIVLGETLVRRRVHARNLSRQTDASSYLPLALAAVKRRRSDQPIQ